MFHKVLLYREATEVAPGVQRVSVIQGGVDLNTISSQATSCVDPWAPSYPLPPMQPQSLQASQIPLPFVHPSQKFILIIDDSVTVRKILETCLGREGFQVKGFPDGIEAIRWLTEPQARTPDLVWLDIGLPKIDGYEVARHIKSKPRFSNTAIVMLSRRDGVLDRLKGRLAGAKDYLSKPFQTQDIVRLTQSYLGLTSSEQEALR